MLLFLNRVISLLLRIKKKERLYLLFQINIGCLAEPRYLQVVQRFPMAVEI